MAKQATANTIDRELDTTEVIAIDPGDVVVLGKALIEECVVSVQQTHHTPVLGDNVAKQHLCFPPKCAAQVVVEIRKQA